MEDKKILELLWTRAESAIDALQKTYGKLLQRIAMNILGLPEDAAECVNDTYLALWNAIPPARPDPLCPFVCRTGRNIALTRLRDDRAQKRYCPYTLSIDELSEVLPDKSMEEMLSARVLGRAIDAFLEEQSKENRILFLRRYWFGDSVQDAARLLGISANTASVRLSRMRDALREYLKREELYYG